MLREYLLPFLLRAEPGRQYQPTLETEERKAAFEVRLAGAKMGYVMKLASRQSKEKMGKQELFNEQDKREAAKALSAQKKAEAAPKDMKR